MKIDQVNLRTGRPVQPKAQYFYCGRGSALGNPFKVGGTSDRNAACDSYHKLFHDELILTGTSARKMLDHMLSYDHVVLGCFCVPQRCHTDTIKQWLEENSNGSCK
jgi:hypothetical protein